MDFTLSISFHVPSWLVSVLLASLIGLAGAAIRGRRTACSRGRSELASPVEGDSSAWNLWQKTPSKLDTWILSAAMNRPKCRQGHDTSRPAKPLQNPHGMAKINSGKPAKWKMWDN
jgi:hypothetical protein